MLITRLTNLLLKNTACLFGNHRLYLTSLGKEDSLSRRNFKLKLICIAKQARLKSTSFYIYCCHVMHLSRANTFVVFHKNTSLPAKFGFYVATCEKRFYLSLTPWGYPSRLTNGTSIFCQFGKSAIGTGLLGESILEPTASAIFLVVWNLLGQILYTLHCALAPFGKPNKLANTKFKSLIFCVSL